MSHPGTGPRGSTADRSLWQWFRDMPRWKKAVVCTSLVAAAIGGVWSLTTGGPGTTSGGGGAASGLSSNLIGGQPLPWPGGENPTVTEEPASRGMFRLGFSFLCGFCIGSFLRATLRLAAIAVGFWFVMTFALNYYGIVDVDWQAMDSLWNRFASNVEQEWGSFQRFMTGSLPAAGLAVTGLAIGLKRH